MCGGGDCTKGDSALVKLAGCTQMVNFLSSIVSALWDVFLICLFAFAAYLTMLFLIGWGYDLTKDLVERIKKLL